MAVQSDYEAWALQAQSRQFRVDNKVGASDSGSTVFDAMAEAPAGGLTAASKTIGAQSAADFANPQFAGVWGVLELKIAPVIEVTATSGSSPSAQADIEWEAVPHATGYEVQRRVDDGEWEAGTPSVVTANETTQTGLASGDWEFRVRAYAINPADGQKTYGPWSAVTNDSKAVVS